MKGVPGTDYIHLIKTTGNYQISKKINGKTVSFGHYSTLDEALFWRDYFKENDWNTNQRLFYSKSNYITCLPSGRYQVIKQHNGTKTSYGTFDTIEEADYQVMLCKRFNWDIRLKPFNCMQYIVPREKYGGGIEYRIWKDDVYYGVFDNLLDAQYERDILMSCDWDIELACEFDERTDGDEWLTGKINMRNFIYRQPNGRIDYDKTIY